MSNSGSNDSVNLDLIDLDSSSSDPSSGEFYEPSSSVLRRARVTIEQTDELLGSTRYLLRNRATNLHSEHQQSTEHPEPQSNQENTEHPEPQSNQENTEHPEPQLNQENTEHPEPQSNKKNQQYSENTEHQKNPKLQIRKMSDQQDPVASDYKAEAHKGVQEYYNKMEQLLHDLISATMEGGDYANGTDIDRLLHNQVLNAFISGLPESYRILLKARGPKKLSDALVFALEEETEENLAKETQLFSMQTNTRNQQQSSKSKTGTSQPGSSSKNNNTNKGCFKCGRTNHFAKDCRAPQRDQDRFKASQQKGQQSSKNTEKTVLICRYCKKQGHELEECRKRKYVNKKKEQEKEAGTETHNAGNGEEPSTTSARSVQQIQSAVLSLQKPSTSQRH
ncbi:hypothetical protein QTP88_007577 [Uroleucon formosanum]